MISDVYFPRINGVSTSIKTFRDELMRLGHRVTLIAPKYPAGTYNDDKDIIRIDSKKVLFDPEDRLMSMRRIKLLTHKLSLKNIDVIHIHTPFVAHYSGTWLSKALDIPCVESYHTFFEEYLYHYIKFLPRTWLKTLARRFSRSQCNDVNHLIVPSTPMHKVLEGYGVNARASIIPTGIIPENFSGGDGQAFREAHGIELDRPVMLYLGRVAHEKNIAFLVHVVAEVKKTVGRVLLIIAGEGPAVNTLKKLVTQLGVSKNVMFIGYLTREKELPDCYTAANVFVFASRTETQGLVLLEAMAAGTPVVSTAVMGTADVLEDKEGALVSEENVRTFSKKVIRVLNHPEVERSLGKSASLYAERWSVMNLTNQLIYLYDEVLEENMIIALTNENRIPTRTKSIDKESVYY